MPIQLSPFYRYETGQPNKTLVMDGESFQAMHAFLMAGKSLVFDFETSGLEYFKHAESCGIALGSWDIQGVFHSYYVPYRHHTGEQQLDLGLIALAIQGLLADQRTLKIAHHIKFDEHMAQKEGWQVRGPRYDTMIGAYFYDENTPKALKTRAQTDLGIVDASAWESRLDAEVHRLAKLSGKNIGEYKNQYGYSQVNIPLAGVYACYDVDFTGQLFSFYEKKGLSHRYPRVWATEMELTGVLCKMEAEGMLVDVPYLTQLREQLGRRKEEVEREFRHVTGGAKFNLASDDALREFLQKDLGLRLTKLTKKKQLSVDKEVLEYFAETHRSIPLIMDWREAEKLYNTYTKSILDRLDDRGYVHPDYQQVGTDTGRTCVAGDTVLDTSIGPLCISDLDLHNNQNVLIMTHRGRLRPILAKYYKGREQMYQVVLDDGSSITCTSEHRFLTPDGWRFLREVSIGSAVCGASEDRCFAQGGQSGKAAYFGRGFFCASSSTGAAYAFGGPRKIRDRPSCLDGFFSFLSRKVCEGIKRGAKLEVCSIEVGEQKRSTSSGSSNISQDVRRIFATGIFGRGDCSRIENYPMVCTAQHGVFRPASEPPIADAVTRNRHDVYQPVRAYISGNCKVSRTYSVLRESARVFFGAVSSVLLGCRSYFFHKAASQGACVLCNSKENPARSYLLGAEYSGIAAFSGVIRVGDSPCPGVHFWQKLSSRFLDFKHLLISRSGWRLSYCACAHNAAGYGEISAGSGSRVSGIEVFAKAGDGRSVNGCPAYPKRVVTGIEAAGIQDVWDIEVGEDCSYVAQGFINHNSCKTPNFQNISSDSDARAVKHTGKKLEDGGADPWSVRRAFLNRGPGWVRLLFDYSQIELRVLAHYSQDPVMVGAYLAGEDIHSRTSMEVFGTAEKSKRRMAKVINFGLSYCMTPVGFARQAKVSEEEAEGYFKKFFERYSGVTTFRQKFWGQVRRNNGGFCNLFGRPRRIFGMNAKSDYERGKAERQAIASIIQGTAAELTKESLVRIAREFSARQLDAHPVATIHDEIQIDCRVDDMPQVARLVKGCMENYPEFAPIPILVDASWTTTNWSEKKGIK